MASSCPNTKTKLINPFIDDEILKEENFIEGDNDEFQPDDAVKHVMKRHTYTIEEKLFFVRLLEDKSQHSIAIDYGIPEKNLRRWKSQVEKLQTAKYKKIARNIIDDGNKPGSEPKTISIENDLISYIKLCRGLEIAIGTNEIIVKAYELMPALRELNYNGIHTWVRRFLKRYNYTLRIPNKVGVTIKDNASEMASNFLLYCHQFLKDNDINEESSFVANMDETPVWNEML